MRKLFFIIPLLVLIFIIILMIGYAKHSCSDGTYIGDCSISNIGYYCDDSKNLIFNCEHCGCQVGEVCINNTCINESMVKEESVSKYNVPSTYYAMDNVHEVAVNPNGKELYVTSIHVPLILVVDIDSEDYPVLGEIKLPGGDIGFTPDIVFSPDGKYVYIARYHFPSYIASWGLKNASYIVVINTVERKIDRIIYPPYKVRGSLAPSPDGRWLYFTAQATPERLGGIGKLDLQSGEVVKFLPFSIVSSFITLSNDSKYIYVTEGEHQQGQCAHPPGFENNLCNLFKVIDTESLELISSVEVGDGPRYIAITPDGSKAYVSNQWNNSVSVINLSTMKVITNINVGPEPREIAITPDGNKAYVALPGVAQMLAGGPGYLGSNRIAVIDTKQDIFLGTVQVHFDPESVATDPDGIKAYVGDGGCNGPTDYAEVHIIDTANDTYLRPIYLRKPAQYAPAGIDITPDNSKLFVTIFNFTDLKKIPTASLLVIDVATGNVTNKFDIDPQAIKVSADGSKVYVFSPASDQSEAKLFIVDSDSLNIIKSINLGGLGTLAPINTNRIILNSAETVAYINYNNWDIHYASEGSMLPNWVDLNDTGLVFVDLVKEKTEKIFYSKTPAVNYHGIALTSDETKLFVSDSASQTVVVINTSTKEIITRIDVGWNPSEIKLSKDRKLYVLQQFGNLMTVVDADSYRVLKNVPAYVHAQMDFEFSPDERYFYAAGFDSNFVLVYDLQEDKVVKVIDTGLDPLDMTITPDGRYIYVSEITGDEIPVIDTTTNNIVNTIKLKK